MRHHGYVAVALAGIAAATGWVLSQSAIVGASENDVTSFREALGSSDEPLRTEPDSSGMRLNYFDARWNRVLGDLAKHSELTLVMDRVPPGRLARRDRTRYSAEDCMRILNRELEGLGYRLLRQGRYLIVLNLDNARTRYARPVVDVESPQPQRRASAESSDNPFMTASDTHQSQAPHASTDDTLFDSRTRQRSLRRDTTTIPIRTAAFQATEDTEEQNNASVDQPVTRIVDIEHGSAGQVARSVYLVFERRAELVRQGIQGFPTFAVYDTNDTKKEGEPLFRVGIDQQDNALIVESDTSRADHLVKLLQRLDKPQQEKESGESAKLLESENMTEETVEELNDQLQHLVAMRRQQGGNDDMPVDDPPAATNRDVSDTSAFNLRGDVNIQAMQELGVLMIEGNEEDLERLSPIIQRLEQMSVGSLPDIHVLELNHVNSEAFTELLNEVYERLAELRQRGEEEQQSVAFFPIVQPNSVLILAPKLELPAILELAEQLDTSLPQGAEFRVYELQNAIASQVDTALKSFYEDRPGLRTRIRTIPDIRTNSIIVQGHPRDLTEVARLIEGLDRDTPGAVHKVEVFPLSHATADELAEVLSGAIQAVTSPPQTAGGAGGGFGGNQGPQELRDTKSIALEFLSTNGDAQELIRSGFLVDVRINADPRSNALIVSAPDASMNLLRALITTLDQPPSAIASIKVFALQNADAEQSVELLTTMFENTNQEEQLGVQIAGAEDASSSLIPLQFTADIRTNTVLAVGSSEALGIVEAILLRLDTDDTRQRTTTVIELRNARSEDVEESINTFLEQQQALQDSSEDLVSNIERLRQEAIVAADPGSNSVIVSASPEYFSRITQIISELDSSKPQVVIQALLVEVQLDNTDEFGVELGFQDPLLFQRSIVETVDDLITIPTSTLVPGVGTVQSTTIVTQNATPGFNFNNTGAPLGNNATGDTGAIGNQGISSFSLGRQNGDLGFGGFVFSAQSDAVNVLIRALAARRTLHVLSRPQIRATHNNLATIQVGQEVPRVNGVVIDEGIVSPQVEIENTGIILEVTPRITPDNSVVMDVLAEKSALNAGGVPVFTDVTTGNTIDSQILDISVARTTVNVPNGQTIVIGGMITKSDQTIERKVPWLGDLPVVGKAFRYDSTSTARTELLIFLTPRIIYSDADAELIKQIESERLHFIESEAEELHGPLYSVPGRRQAGLQHVVPQDDQLIPEIPMEDPAFQSDARSKRSETDTADQSNPKSVPQASRKIRRPPIRQASAQGNNGASDVRRADLTDEPAAETRRSWMNQFLRPKTPTSRDRDKTARHDTKSVSTSEEAVPTFDFDSPDWSDMADEDNR